MTGQREQQVLDPRELQMTEPHAKALCEACETIISTYPNVPKEWAPFEILSLAIQAVVAEAEDRGVSQINTTEVLAKALGCHVIYCSVDEDTVKNLRGLVIGWIDEAIARTPRNMNPAEGGPPQ